MDDVCVVGGATVRLDTGLVDELFDKVRFIRDRRPDLLTLDYARERNVWV
ncbi:MAG: hypothetical protein N3H84_01560 [Candidatus Caldarchaeum sp.]|nr:hypothetical protein [Candidatus Caldarchaeum sp.]